MIDLHGLLILVPSFGGLAGPTELCVAAYRMHGAYVERSMGMSHSCALHRCLMAQAAQRVLDEQPDLATVLWFDADMVAMPTTIALHLALLNALGDAVQRPREQWPALSGCYVQRNRNGVIAARNPHPGGSLDLVLPATAQTPAFRFDPVVAGMGALMQTREAFLAHCAEAELITAENGSKVPVVTYNRMVDTDSGKREWGGEDMVYCAWEWDKGRGVYLSRDVPYGHVCESVQYPGADARLPDCSMPLIDVT